MIDRCILHIGTEKTGTTSIQEFLHLNRRALASQGIHVPVRLGRPEHIALAHAVLDEDKRFSRRNGPHGPGRTGAGRMRARAARLITAELARARATGARTVILSSERLGALIDRPEEMARLRALLSPLFQRVDIVVYLRPQPDFATSYYSTDLRNGSLRRSVLPDLDRSPRHAQRLDYATRLEFWAQHWPEAQLSPRLFTPDALPRGDVLADFFARADIDITGMPRPPRQNGTLGARAQLFLRRLNWRCAKDPAFARRIDRAAILRNLEQGTTGPGRKPSRAAARAFLARFAEGNERIRARWFPERRTLFVAPLRDYPPRATALRLTTAEFRRMLARLSPPPSPLRRAIRTALRRVTRFQIR